MKKEVKVGVFVMIGLLLMGTIVFVIGDNRQVWARKTQYHASFADVAGLKPGAPVRMGGIDIGSVTSVDYSSDVADPRVHVRMAIVRSEAERIRVATVARIVNKGLLGDKMVEFTVAPLSSPELDPQTALKTEEPADMLGKFNEIANKADRVIEKADRVTGALADPQFTEDLKGTVKSLRAILDGIALHDGPAHRLIFDHEEAVRIDHTISNLQSATSNLDGLLADARDVTTHVKNGPGLAHGLVYDGEMSQSAAGALNELHEDLAAVRRGNGLLHALVYGDTDTQHLMGNVNAMSDDLRQIVANVKAGKGTIGALLVDPSVYEDLRSLVGNVQRNDVLRALVRYSIKADEKNAPRVETPPPPPAPHR